MHFTVGQLEHERLENKRLQTDSNDLQVEFERDRQEYLNTIREQEKRMLLFRTMLTQMSQLVPRSCNYSNLDRIMDQARFDEEKNRYVLPEPTKDEVQFPQMVNSPIKRQEQLLNESSVLQRAKRPLQTSNIDQDYMNRRLNPFDVPAHLASKYGFSSGKP